MTAAAERPAPTDAGALGGSAPSDDLTEDIRRALSVVLGVPLEGVRPESSLRDLAADSLVLVSLADIVEQTSADAGRAVRFDDADLARAATVRDLASCARP